jgi:acid phosphatase
MSQHEELGQFYRRRLINELHFLPEHFDPALISLRSSQVDRCVRSLVSFINGMYPPAYMHELLTIQTGTETFERLLPDTDTCADLQRDYDIFSQTEEFAARANRSHTVLRPLYEYLNLTWDGINWMWIGDWVFTYLCSNQTVPGVVTEEMMTVLMEDAAYSIAGLFRMFPLDGAASSWRLLLNAVDAVLTGYSSTKLHMFSTHDVTLASILEALGHHVTDQIPPFRSHLLVELYDRVRPSLRFVYNGEVLKVNGSELVPLARFKMAVLPGLTRCMEKGWLL